MPSATTRLAPAASAPPFERKLRLTLTLDGIAYTVRPVARGAMPADAVRAFTLSRADAKLGRVTHMVAETILGPVCSCGDQTYRQTPAGGQCKHLAAALACGLF